MKKEILAIGFIIVICSIGGMFYISNIFIPEQLEIIAHAEEMRMASIRYLDDWEDAWDMYYDMGIQAEENVETAKNTQSGLPFVILAGVVIMFIGFLIKQDVPEDNASKSKEKDALDILKTRYAKGEITKEEYEQMKKDMDG